MPATFAHCLLARKAIDGIQKKIKKNEQLISYAQKIGENNHFVVLGSASPDYPYLTNIITTGIIPISHTWANRMHYENTNLFIREGLRQLVSIDKKKESFAIRLSWLCGYLSHVIADSYLHPVVNAIVGGQYMFTHAEHAKCELIQDIYIFKKLTGEDIVNSNARTGSFGFLKILDQCSDIKDGNRIHPEIRDYWKKLLIAAHPNAVEYFNEIDPDAWHSNYKSRVNFVSNRDAIFRHLIETTGRAYKEESNITAEERNKYITNINLPDGTIANYDKTFSKTVDLIAATWQQMFKGIESNDPDGAVSQYVKDWNLDTGVDETKIDLWS
ncbi:hypothetical protein DS62_13550 [Smithella sp. SC_K08D17]|jgi:hypothetical protein|nr:hypothetical protein DS62_13550 [Smithella sp. SC_K08D17]MDD5524960.1 zinc dependent phospholipase C family protein [Smithella sp.]